MKAVKIIGDVLFYLVMILIVIGAFLFAHDKNPQKTIFGYRVYEVLSASMEPSIQKGALAVVKAVDSSDIKQGDIVTFYPNQQTNTTVTHRVAASFFDGTELFFQTKGDAAPGMDEPVSAAQMIGVVQFSIPFLGAWIGWIRNHFMVSVILALGAVLIGLLFPKLVKRKRVVPSTSN